MAHDRIAIHWIDLDASEVADASLSAAERARAARLRLPVERRRFIAGRATLRALVAARLGCSPAAVPLVVGAHGKPLVAGSRLAFSLSHSGGTAVIAIGGERPIGVDCEAIGEAIGDGAAMRDAIEPMLSPAERNSLAAGAEARAVLHRLWTRKEAIAKADGIGMGFPFAAATVLGEGAVAVPGHGSFRVRDLAAPAGFAAALAGAGPAPLALV